MSSSDQVPVINSNHSLQKYYASLESRVGYRLLLGGTRHFGYYEGSSWPFPISKALRAMEDHLFHTLGLDKGALALDAGCGVGHVAIHLARKGLKVEGIDVVDRSLETAKQNIAAAGLESAISLQKMDYHHLDGYKDSTFEAVYTMETFVHATDPEAAIREFFRILKPGGRIASYEYHHINLISAPPRLKDAIEKINNYASMPSNARFDKGVHQKMLEEAGFQDVSVRDLTANVLPMLKLFFILAYVPYLFVRLLGLEAWFVNTTAGVEGYRAKEYCKYMAVSARKPGQAGEGESET